jgi:TolA-binding protein
VRAPAAGLALLLPLAALPAGAQAPASPEQQARGLLEDGRAYLRDGKHKQALDNFNTIVTGFAATDAVDDALLEIGRYQMDVERSPEKAREAFDQVAKRFPQSDGAPGAYYYLGLLTLRRATATAELDDALAQFARVQRLYPRSSWVPRALLATAQAYRKAGRMADAVDAGRRVTLEHPSSDAAPAAHFEVGQSLALQGEPRPAMEEFQQIRNHFPDSVWAGPALDRITALYRLYGAGKPTFAVDPAYAAGSGDLLKDVRAILMTPARTLWLASDKVKAAVPVGPDGKLGASHPAAELKGLGLGPSGEVVVTAKLAVRFGPRDVKSFSVPSDKPGVPEPLERIEAAVLTPGGSILVADGKKKRVYRFDPAGQHQGTFPDSREREVIHMLVDGEGAVLMLDKEARAVLVLTESGAIVRTIPLRGGGFEVKRPADVAVDSFRNLYLADEEGFVHVLSPLGQLLVTLAAPEMKKPTAVTVDPAGAVLVYDDRAERVLRFR